MDVLLSNTRPIWEDQAACRGKPIDDFFPLWNHTVGGLGHQTRIMFDRARAADAIAVCRTCAVIDECREAHRHEVDGVFFGTVPLERVVNNPRRMRTYYETKTERRQWCGCMACHTTNLRWLGHQMSGG